MTESELDFVLRKAFEQIAEEEYKRDMENAQKNNYKFSKEHERKMKKLFRDISKGRTPKSK